MIYFVIFIVLLILINGLINTFRYIRISIYYEKYKINCKKNRYYDNISFYLPVTKLFDNADTNRVDIRNGDVISEQLQEADYERELHVCFLKTKARYKYLIFCPQHFLLRQYPGKTKIANRIIVLLKSVLLFVFGQVFSSILDASGIGNILLEWISQKFLLLGSWLSGIALL